MTYTRCLLASFLTVFALTAIPSPAEDAKADGGPVRVYVGTYTAPDKSQGIYMLNLDPDTGALTDLVVAAETSNPSFLALHPSGQHLYAVGEINDFAGKKAGAVSAFSVDPATGKLSLLNQQPSGGAGPCHVSTDPTGKCVFVANYGGGSVASLPVTDEGSLSEAASVHQHEGASGSNPKRQEKPHAHFITPDPAGRFVLACDLGADKVFVYRYSPKDGTLAPNDPPSADLAPGAGPRHLAFHPTGNYVYVINELANTVTAFAYDPEAGSLTELHTVPTLPEGLKVENNTTAQIVAHPSGKFVYGSNRGHDSIAIFTVDEQTGRLTPAGHQSTGGKTPRNFNVDPTGRWLVAANQNSDTLVVFKVDPETGALEQVGEPVAVPSPVCVTFAPPAAAAR